MWNMEEREMLRMTPRFAVYTARGGWWGLLAGEWCGEVHFEFCCAHTEFLLVMGHSSCHVEEAAGVLSMDLRRKLYVEIHIE